MKVALVVMPFAAVTRPSLAAGLLQANLQREGIRCDALYANLVLGEMLGTAAYRRFSSEAVVTALAGEWAFSQLFFGQRLSNWDSYRREVLDDPHWGAGADRHAGIQSLVAIAPAFLDRVFSSSNWTDYDLVGFTSTFEQTMPSLCLARMIRDAAPDTLLAIGGANLEAGMGAPYLRHFEFLDFVSTSEADTTFTVLCRNLREHRAGRSTTIGVPEGILFRTGGRLPLVRGTPLPPVDMEASPTPSYDDYFTAVTSTSGADAAVQHWLPVEASRGCWWGEKVHCTFCGLNGETMRFRAKSGGRVREETRELVARYGIRRVQFADNILGADYFASLLPDWADSGDTVEKFFEIRSNLTRDQLALLRRAGVTTVQAGVESLSDRTLHLMGKGVSGAQNLALLRWCAELGIDPLWNLIYGFPHEHLADYATTVALIRDVMHLPPPDAAAPIRMDRFSPNFSRWGDQGFTVVEPMPAYRHVFPFPAEDLEAAAYYFRFDHPQLAAARELGRQIEGAVAEWQRRRRDGTGGQLFVLADGDRLVLRDTRRGEESRGLDTAAIAWLVACDRPASPETAAARVRRLTGQVSGAVLDRALHGLLEQRVILQTGPRLVTLACLPPPVRSRFANPPWLFESPIPLHSLPDNHRSAHDDTDVRCRSSSRGADAWATTRGADAWATTRGADAGPATRGADAGPAPGGADAGPAPGGADAAPGGTHARATS
jgi:ribosomal peptide maturation radical SAM protein 1